MGGRGHQDGREQRDADGREHGRRPGGREPVQHRAPVAGQEEAPDGRQDEGEQLVPRQPKSPAAHERGSQEDRRPHEDQHVRDLPEPPEEPGKRSEERGGRRPRVRRVRGEHERDRDADHRGDEQHHVRRPPSAWRRGSGREEPDRRHRPGEQAPAAPPGPVVILGRTDLLIALRHSDLAIMSRRARLEPPARRPASSVPHETTITHQRGARSHPIGVM